MIRKLISSALLAAAIVGGSFIGTGTASADANPAVCDGIAEAPSYTAYLLDAFVWGKAFNYSPETQARNIVSSVMVFCPWHAPGIKAAATYLSSDGGSNA